MLADVREIILATDGDGPGVNLMNDLAIRLGKARCKFVRYPKETKDFNEAS
jgi:twinkle protein